MTLEHLLDQMTRICEADVGPFIQELRMDAGITQKMASDATGFSIQTISKFENGRSNPNSFSSRRITNYILEEIGINTGEALVLFYKYRQEDEDFPIIMPVQ